MSLPKDQAWFTAKRYGYGWGFPARWQGWMVLGIYLACVLFAGLRLAPTQPMQFAVFVAFLSILLVCLCAWKGEPAKWRWGRPDDDKPA
jgi:hypothetical protein